MIVPRDHVVDYLSSASDQGSLDFVTEYVADICAGLLESDSSSAATMWSAFCNGSLKRRGGMTKVTPETWALVLLTTLRTKAWGLWNDIIASMAGGKLDLPNSFFFDVCEEHLMGEITFNQVQDGWV